MRLGAAARRARHPLLATPLVLSIELAIVDDLRAPLVRYLPDAELAVLAARKEHVLQLVVVDDADSLLEARVQLQNALASLLDVSDQQVALLCALTVAGHAREPFESGEAVIFAALVRINLLNDGRFDATFIDELDDAHYAILGPAD